MAAIVIRDRQTVVDVAVQHSGSSLAAFDICVLNDVAITDDLITASCLKNEIVKNKQVVQALDNDKIIPISQDASIEDGINHWTVGIDFKVS